MSEQGIRAFSVIVVSIYVARFLGPKGFGVISYAMALTTLFLAIARLGMESILVREVADKKLRVNNLMGTAFWLMFAASGLAVLVLNTLVNISETDSLLIACIFFISLGIFFQPFFVIDYGFQGQIKAKYSSIAKTIAVSISSLIKIGLVFCESDLIFIAIAYACDNFFVALFLLIVHKKVQKHKFVNEFKWSFVKNLLKSAWPMVLSTLSIVLYMRVDQLMIKHLLGIEELGVYASATRIYEGCAMIFVVFTNSLLPLIVDVKNSSKEEFTNKMILIFRLVFWVAVGLAFLITLYSKEIITITFGLDYIGSQEPLEILMWALAFTGMGSVTARYLTAERQEKKIAIRTFVALAINLCLNFLLIPIYGITGAAISTLISITIANYFIDYTDKQLKTLIYIKNNAIFLGLIGKNIRA